MHSHSWWAQALHCHNAYNGTGMQHITTAGVMLYPETEKLRAHYNNINYLCVLIFLTKLLMISPIDLVLQPAAVDGLVVQSGRKTYSHDS